MGGKEVERPGDGVQNALRPAGLKKVLLNQEISLIPFCSPTGPARSHSPLRPQPTCHSETHRAPPPLRHSLMSPGYRNRLALNPPL